MPTYLKPFVDDATDDEEDVDEFEGRGMLVVVVVVVVDDEDADGGVMRRPFVVVVTEEYSECVDVTDRAGLDCLD